MYYPLTEPQKRIYYVEQIHPGTSIHTIGGTVRIKGPLSFDKLANALEKFIHSHAAMRIRLTLRNEEPVQYVEDCHAQVFPFFDFSLYPNPEAMFHEWVNEVGSTPFKLYDAPLYEFVFFRLNANEGGYLIKLHHLIADMWSISLLTEQIKKFYENDLSDIFSNYLDYLPVETSYLLSSRYQLDKEFWLNTFADLPVAPQARQDGLNTITNRLTRELSPKTTDTIQKFAGENGLSFNDIFNALVLLYFFIKKGMTKKVIDIPIFNRSNWREKQTVGMYVSTLPFYLEIDPLLSVKELFVKVRKTLRVFYTHHRFPFSHLSQQLASLNIDLTAAMDVAVNYYNMNHPIELDGYKIVNEEFHNSHQIYKLHFIINQWNPEQIQIHIQYQTEFFDEQEIALLFNDLMGLIRLAAEEPEKQIHTISLLSQNNEIYNSLPYLDQSYQKIKDQTPLEIIQRQSEENPNRIALHTETGIEISYQELIRRVDHLAYRLETYGSKKPIIVYGRPSAECIYAILAIHKLGLPYVPLDPSTPAHQIEQIVEDTAAELLLYWKEKPAWFKETCSQINVCGNSSSSAPFQSKAVSNGLAYMIYTSGSTGKPKGVKVSQRNLMAYLDWAKIYTLHQHPVFAFYSSIAFDLTVTSIFLPLLVGGKIKVFSSDFQYALLSIIEDREVTLFKATPSHLELIKEVIIKGSSLAGVIVGGENFSTDLASKLQGNWGSRVAIYNEYGPTEATVGCMLHRFDPEEDRMRSVPVGSAAGTTHLLILDENKKPVGPGEKGELYIGGDQVAEGYLNRIEETASRFIHLFNDHRIYYKTGDLVSENPSGKLVYYGRLDDQLKINGYRIELGEIEHCILEYPAIISAFVLPHKGTLAAFIVSDNQIDINDLLLFLKERIASYKLPAAIKQIKCMPLNGNGKVEKRLLLKELSESTPENPQQTPLDSVVISVFQQFLRRHVSLNENFFQVGGDSIMAIQIASKLASQQIDLSVKSILTSSTIGEILSKAQNKIEKIYPIAKGEQQPTPILKWFLQLELLKPDYYHQSLLLKLNNFHRPDQIEHALTQLVALHDTFRLNLEPSTGRFLYNDALLHKKISLTSFDIRHLSDSESRVFIAEAANELKNQTDIANDCLLKAAIFFRNTYQELLLVAHHLSIDGVSWQILLEDLSQILLKKAVKKEITFQQWTSEVAKQYRNKQFPPHFQTHLTSLPLHSRGHVTERFSFSKEITKKIVQACINSSISLTEFLITVFLETLVKLGQPREIAVMVENHGRFALPQLDASRTVGWFTVMWPILFKVGNNSSITLSEAKERLHQYQMHAELLALDQSWLNFAHRTYRFNFIGHVQSGYDQFSIREIGVGEDYLDEAKPPLDFNVLIFEEKLVHVVAIAKNLPFTLEQFKKLYSETICSIEFTQTQSFQPTYETVHLETEDLEELVKL